MNKKHAQRFGELQQQLEHIESTRHKKRLERLNNLEVDMVDSLALCEWKVKAKSLPINVCGADFEYYKEFKEAEKPGVMNTPYELLLYIRSIFRAAKEDGEGGCLSSVRSLVQAEVLDSVLEQSSGLLMSGYHTARQSLPGLRLKRH